MEDVHLWMIDQHLGRRSVSDFQRGVLALRKREIVAERRAAVLAAAGPAQTPTEHDAAGNAEPPASPTVELAPEPLNSREAIARAARLSSSQLVMIEKIRKQAAPELVAAVKSGTISLNAAAAVASLPAQEQVAAAIAGKDELKQAAKRVRDAKRKPREEPVASAEDSAPDMVAALQQRVAELTAENAALRQQVAELSARQ
jgi:hypothetical protein